MQVDDVELPLLLSSNLREGLRSLQPDETALLRKLLTRIEAPSPVMYGRDEIFVANRVWSSAHVNLYLGHRTANADPGEIDPEKALIIGHAEPDSPIALDYRSSPPGVVYLGDVDHKTCWFQLASSYEALFEALRPVR